MSPEHETLVNFQKLKRAEAKMIKGQKRMRNEFYKMSRKLKSNIHFESSRTGAHSEYLEAPFKSFKGKVKFNNFTSKIPSEKEVEERLHKIKLKQMRKNTIMYSPTKSHIDYNRIEKFDKGELCKFLIKHIQISHYL